MSKAVFYTSDYPEGFSENLPGYLLDGRPLFLPKKPEVTIGLPTDDIPSVIEDNKVEFIFVGYDEFYGESLPVYKDRTMVHGN